MNWFKQILKRYDDWCKAMGLTPEQKRSCVPYKTEPTEALPTSHKRSIEKSSNETV